MADQPQAKPNKPPKAIRAGFRDREFFINDLTLLLKSGVAVGEALQSISKSVSNKAIKQALTQMQVEIDNGSSLSEALKRSGIVTGQTLALVELGEASGQLIQNLELAGQQEEKRHIFASQVRSALLYPVFVLVLTFVVALAVAWFLLPRLSQTFGQLKVALPPISQAMINVGLFLRDYGVYAVPAFLAVCFLIFFILFIAPKTKHIGKRLLFKLPGIGKLLQEVELAQFGYLLGTLLNAGLPIRQAVELMGGSTTAPQYAQLYRYLAHALGDGWSFKDALGKYKNSSKLLYPGAQQMIFAGEQSGALPDVLLTIGNTYEQKSQVTTKNLESVIEPMLLVVVAGGVLLVAVAVILPVYSLIGGLQE